MGLHRLDGFGLGPKASMQSISWNTSRHKHQLTGSITFQWPSNTESMRRRQLHCSWCYISQMICHLPSSLLSQHQLDTHPFSDLITPPHLSTPHHFPLSSFLQALPSDFCLSINTQTLMLPWFYFWDPNRSSNTDTGNLVPLTGTAEPRMLKGWGITKQGLI